LAGAEIELEALLRCKVGVLTAGPMAPDVEKRVAVDLESMP
jgi:hypothetical protein